MGILRMGNANPVEWISTGPASTDGHFVAIPLPAGATEVVTELHFPDSMSALEVSTTLTTGDGVWARHNDGTSVPTWVASDNSLLASIVSDELGCPVVPL